MSSRRPLAGSGRKGVRTGIGSTSKEMGARPKVPRLPGEPARRAGREREIERKIEREHNRRLKWTLCTAQAAFQTMVPAAFFLYVALCLVRHSTSKASRDRYRLVGKRHVQSATLSYPKSCQVLLVHGHYPTTTPYKIHLRLSNKSTFPAFYPKALRKARQLPV